jgi:hypothetical protein
MKARASDWVGYAQKTVPGAFIAAWASALQNPLTFMAARREMANFQSFRSAGYLRVRLSGPRIELNTSTELPVEFSSLSSENTEAAVQRP